MNFRLFLVIFLGIWTLSSCKFTETNLDPTRDTDATLQEMLPAAIVQSVRNSGSIGARVTGIVIQHFKGIDAQPEGYNSYLIDSRTLNRLWETGIYAGALKDCQQIIEKAKESQQAHYQGIANILAAYNLGIATSYWGDIPWSQALQPRLYIQPAYDSQEEVYASMQHLLDEAITLLGQAPKENGPAEDDLIYGGDSEKWIACAWALKARYYLHLSKKDPLATDKVLQAYANGVFESIEDQARLFYGNTLNESNPLTLFSLERPNQIVLGDFLKDLLISTQDPRLNTYAALSEDVYRIYQEGNPDLYWGQLDAPVSLISLSEVKFILAETYLRENRIPESEQMLKEAVWSNFEELAIDQDPIILNYFNSSISFKGLDSYEKKLEYIMTQKYISLFGQGINESWVDIRRTGYPQLRPPLQANSSFNPSLVIPQRYLYPISESSTNSTHMQEAISRQGGHLLDVKLWMFQ